MNIIFEITKVKENLPLLLRNYPFQDIIFYLSDCFGLAQDKVHLYTLKNGMRAFVRTGSSDRGVMLRGMNGFEYKELLNYSKILRNKLTIVDIGANIGSFSLWMQRNFTIKKHILVEPVPSNLFFLKKNLMVNKVKNTIIYPRAIYHKRTTVQFKTNGDHAIGFIDLKRGDLTIKTITLSEIFKDNHLKDVDVLKIDVEGGEWNILTETNKQFYSKVKLIVMEYHIKNQDHSVNRLTHYFSNFRPTNLPIVRGLGLLYLLNKKV